MAQKVCSLLTSPEKSQQTPGSGCSSTDSDIPTGKTVAAILKKKEGLYSQLEILSHSALAASFENQKKEQIMQREESGMSGETATSTPRLLDREIQQC